MIKVAGGTIENEAKWQKDGLCGMLLGTFGTSLLEKWLTGKYMHADDGFLQAGGEMIRAGHDF